MDSFLITIRDTSHGLLPFKEEALDRAERLATEHSAQVIVTRVRRNMTPVKIEAYCTSAGTLHTTPFANMSHYVLEGMFRTVNKAIEKAGLAA